MDSVHSFMKAFIEQTTRCNKNVPVTVEHSEYSTVIRLIRNPEQFIVLKFAQLTNVRIEVAELKSLTVATF